MMTNKQLNLSSRFNSRESLSLHVNFTPTHLQVAASNLLESCSINCWHPNAFKNSFPKSFILFTYVHELPIIQQILNLHNSVCRVYSKIQLIFSPIVLFSWSHSSFLHTLTVFAGLSHDAVWKRSSRAWRGLLKCFIYKQQTPIPVSVL